MKNVKIGARALLVMSQADWRLLITNTVNLKIGARAKVVVVTEDQRRKLMGTITASIKAGIAKVTATATAEMPGEDTET